MKNPVVCVALDGTTLEDVKEEAALAALGGADIVEFRVDRLLLIRPEPTLETDERTGRSREVLPPEETWARRDIEEVDLEASIKAVLQAVNLPTIITVRPLNEGGFYTGEDSDRLALLRTGIEGGASHIDLELSIEAKARQDLVELARSKDCSVIASFHDMDGTDTSDDIKAWLEANADSGDLLKYCSTARSTNDGLQLVKTARAMKDSDLEFSLMARGRSGDWTRIHAPVLNQSMVYATLRKENRLSDAGLVNVRDLKDAWIMMEY